MGEGKGKDAIVQAHYTTEDIAGRIVAAVRR